MTSGRFLSIALLGSLVAAAPGADIHRVYDQGQQPNDQRLEDLKDLNGYFPFQVPESRGAWEARAAELRRRVLVATGLWPMPPKTPLNPVIHGKTSRPGFTVEKVYFESLPQHFVTGLLFRPDGPAAPKKGQRAAVLCPHGHGGRLQDYGEKKIRQLIADGAERFEGSGRYPKLARCAQLARMGCVVLIFDMLGYADSGQISYQLAHRFAKQRPDWEGSEKWGLFSTQAELRMQSIMGLQTWNSIRALDFLAQLPEVDPQRIGVTGGSGGGTQTILLCAIDSRPAAAFPNGMVSTAMQGGCTCENCCLLRIGTGNVELAALFAPKPQAMTAANDWTRDMMTKGFPELQQLYRLLGAPKNVDCRPLLHFPHNYNYVSRATMYRWFNRHLDLGLEEPIVEEDFEPLTADETTVWNAQHPRPVGGDAYERRLIRQLTDQSDKLLADLAPRDEPSLQEFRRVVGGAWSTLIGRGLPNPEDIQRTKLDKQKKAGYLLFKDTLRLTTAGEEFPFISLFPISTDWNREVVIWIDAQGKRGLFDEAGELRTSAATAGRRRICRSLWRLVSAGRVPGGRRAAAATAGRQEPTPVRRIHLRLQSHAVGATSARCVDSDRLHPGRRARGSGDPLAGRQRRRTHRCRRCRRCRRRGRRNGHRQRQVPIRQPDLLPPSSLHARRREVRRPAWNSGVASASTAAHGRRAGSAGLGAEGLRRRRPACRRHRQPATKRDRRSGRLAASPMIAGGHREKARCQKGR